jgi:DNA processing protein
MLLPGVQIVDGGSRCTVSVPRPQGLSRAVRQTRGETTSSLSAGTNELLKLGATSLTSAGDVLDVLGVDRREPSAAVDVSTEATKLLELVREAPAGADELAARGAGDAGAVSVALTELELAGLVAAADGVYRASRSAEVR